MQTSAGIVRLQSRLPRALRAKGRTSRLLSTRSRSHFGSLYGLSSACRRANRAIPSLFILLRTLLHPCKTQLFCFQAIAHSLPKNTRVGGIPFSHFHYSLIHLSKPVASRSMDPFKSSVHVGTKDA